MELDSKEVFERLQKAFGINTLTGLSKALGNQSNWATLARKRGAIPYEACVIASEKFGISIDYLLTGRELEKAYIDKNDLKIAVTEGLFTTIQTELISLNDGAKISMVANAICDEVVESLNIEHEESAKKTG